MSSKREEVEKRLRTASATAQAWVDAKPGEGHLGDYVASRAMGRDVLQIVEQTLAQLSTNSISVEEAEQVAQICEQTLESTAEKRQAALRGLPELPADLQAQ